MTVEVRARPAILKAGRELLEMKQPSQVSMASVASASGYSRMAVYRHFGSRAGLLAALLAYIDEVEGAEAAVRALLDEARAEDLLRRLFVWWSGYVPRFAGIARGVLAAKHADADLQGAWDERMHALRRVVDAAAGRCVDDDIKSADFADQLWALMSVPLWIQLADEGWSADRYARTMAGLAVGALPFSAE